MVQNTTNMFELIYGLGPDQPPTGGLVKPELRRSVLYNMSPIEVTKLPILTYIYMPNQIRTMKH